MTGSMYAAIAGLRTHMQNLNVIGHNIANVNTETYKSQRAIFETSIYSTTSGGSDGTEVVGGRNPSQIGYGSNLASVDIDMSTGTYKVTGKPTDCMINGDGFFLTGDKTLANNFTGEAGDVDLLTSLTLTRLGDIGFKSDGYLTNRNGEVVYGFMCTGVYAEGDQIPEGKKVGDPIFSDQLVPIRFPRVYTDTVTDNTTTPPTVTERTRIAYAVDPGEGGHLRDATATDMLGEGGTLPEGQSNELSFAQFTGITIDKATGLITGTSNDTQQVVTIGCLAVGQVTNPNGVTQVGNSNYKAGPGSGELTISILGGGASELGISYVNASLRGEDAGDDVARIDGLRIRGGGNTSLMTSGLESSKADLAQEIANMIVTQRGYQANTRIITVTDSMLEELVNMKR